MSAVYAAHSAMTNFHVLSGAKATIILIKSTKPHLLQYEKVVLMGASHFSNDPRKSCQYTHIVKTYLERRLPVQIRMGMTPDQDLVYAALAQDFHKNGGGYSRVLEQVHDWAKKAFDAGARFKKK